MNMTKTIFGTFVQKSPTAQRREVIGNKLFMKKDKEKSEIFIFT